MKTAEGHAGGACPLRSPISGTYASAPRARRCRLFERTCTRRYSALALLLAATVPRFAHATLDRTTIVVHTLRSTPEHTALARRLTDDMLVHLGRREGLAVLGDAELDLILEHVSSEAGLSQADCRRAEECLARITEAANAEKLLSGSLGKLGDSFVITLSLIDAAKAAVQRTETCTAENESELGTCILEIADRALGSESTPKAAFSLHYASSKVAVAPMTGLDDRPDIAASLTQLFGLELRRSGMAVITADEVIAMIDHVIQRESCKGTSGDLTSCLIEVGGAMGAEYLATGAIGRFDETFVLVLKLIDLRRAEVVHRISESYRGPESQLPHAIRFATDTLLGREPTGTGALLITTSESGELTLDAGELRRLPSSDPIAGLATGKHAVFISTEDYLPYHAEVYVAPDAITRFEPALVERSSPLYESPWFWAISGAVVAAGTLATILVLEPPTTSDGSATLAPR